MKVARQEIPGHLPEDILDKRLHVIQQTTRKCQNLALTINPENPDNPYARH